MYSKDMIEFLTYVFGPALFLMLIDSLNSVCKREPWGEWNKDGLYSPDKPGGSAGIKN